MFRNLFLVIAIIALFLIIKGFIRRAKNTPASPATGKDMVQCTQCKVYLSQEDAIVSNNQNFCSQRHLEEWKQKH
ncbi:MAG: PP0621 family protein [Gammaproteobacteria bacterium]|nr:PP0621 family protein [Gammaproteobacteria bacterium]